MRVSARAALIVLWVFALQNAWAKTATDELTLARCLEIAWNYSTAVLKAKNDVELSGEQLAYTYAQYKPTLRLASGANYVQGTNYVTLAAPAVVNTKNYGINVELSTTVNLFNGFRDEAAVEAARSRKAASELSLERARQLIALDVAQSYLQVILDRQVLGIAEKNLEASRARRNLLTAQGNLGSKNRADMLRQEAQLSSDELFFANTQNKEKNDLLDLLQKLRLPVDRNYTLASAKMDMEAHRVGQEAELIRTALDSRLDMQAASQTAKAASADKGVASATLYPKVDFGAWATSVGRSLQAQTVNGVNLLSAADQKAIPEQLGSNIIYTLGVTLSWDLWDRDTTNVAIQKSKIAMSNSQIDLEDRRNRIVWEVRKALADYQMALRQIETADRGAEAADKALALVNGLYSVGSASFVDLTTAESMAVQAHATQAQARISTLLNWYALRTALGEKIVE